VDRDHLRGRVVIRELVAEVRRAADEARAAGADVVVCVVHSGFDEPSSYDTTGTGPASENVTARIAREVPGLDLVVFGHSHRQRAEAVGGTFVLQPRNWAAQVGVAHLGLARDAAARRAGASSRCARATGADARGARARRVLAATEAAHAAHGLRGDAVGTTPVAWRADSARVADARHDLVLEVMRRRAGRPRATALLARRPSTRARTVAEVARLYPYENTLRAVRVTGAQLRAFLEQSARYSARRPGGGIDPPVPASTSTWWRAPTTRSTCRAESGSGSRLLGSGRSVADAHTFTPRAQQLPADRRPVGYRDARRRAVV
jgi:2',3'-cyclic-nucleotide 2'-phosphodiesterase/3'-nucleotidase